MVKVALKLLQERERTTALHTRSHVVPVKLVLFFRKTQLMLKYIIETKIAYYNLYGHLFSFYIFSYTHNLLPHQQSNATQHTDHHKTFLPCANNNGYTPTTLTIINTSTINATHPKILVTEFSLFTNNNK
jgi:hypothetical protein